VIVKGVNKSHYPIQNPLLLVTEPQSCDNICEYAVYIATFHGPNLLILPNKTNIKNMTIGCIMYHLNGKHLLWLPPLTSEWLSPKTQSIKTAMRRVQRCQIKLSELHFHIPQAVLFCCFRFENYGPRKPRQ
jgi:hypothetical protein